MIFKKIEENNKVCVMAYIISLVKHVNKGNEEIEEVETIRAVISNPDY